MMVVGSFDVFFSYATRDHAAVERVARELSRRGVRVFLDRWYLTPGLPWPQALERTVAACGAVAVFVGGEGLGPWQQRERDLALDRQGREPEFPVIPVLLTSSDPGLGFLRLNTWVDLSAGVEDETALGILAAAIRGEPPGVPALERSATARAAVCPYRGLRPFREEDEPFFFGRAAFAETLTATALRQSFVAVVGGSGSGKSSVVRAGLVPRLRRGAGGLVWDAAGLVPTDRPLHSLAGALLPMLEPDLSEVDRLAEVGKLAGHLAAGAVPLRDVTARVLARQPGTDRLLLFVDQWEEIYTLCMDDAARTTFIDLLLDAASADAVRVVLTLRGDFMGHALAHRALADRLQGAMVTVGPMTRDELAETIARPAEKVGLGFEPGLAETILDEVADEPGTLPLLEFLLEGLWGERRGSMLTHEAYVRLGRVSGAIAHRAESVFEAGLGEAEREAAQRLLVRMIRPGEGVEDTRRRAVVPGTDPMAQAIIRKLAAERLVVTERDAGSGEVTVEVAHEALIRGWHRLREWVDHDRDFLRTRERIATQAATWETEGRPADRLLPTGRPLVEAEDLLANRRSDLEPGLLAYIEASVAAARAGRRRQKALRLAVMAALSIMTITAASFARFAWQQWEDADRNAAAAQLNESRALAALASVEAETGSPATALRMALAALPEKLADAERPYAPEAEGTLSSALTDLREERRFVHDDWVSSVALSADGTLLATGAADGTARLWDAATGRQITVLRGHEAAVSAVAFSPDGKLLATGSEDRTARLWNVTSGTQVAVLRDHEAPVTSVAFDAAGEVLATGAEDKAARLWNVTSGQELSVLRGQEGPVTSVAMGADGKLLVTGHGDGTVTLWDPTTGAPITVLHGHEAAVTAIALAATGNLLATGSEDKTARLWELPGGRQLAVLRGHDAEVYAVSLDAAGKLLATGSWDDTARLWDTATGKQIAVLRGHDDGVSAVALRADGKMLATGSEDKTARLWKVADAEPSEVLHGHEDGISDVALGPEGKLLVTGSADRTARLWNLPTGEQTAVLSGHEEAVLAVALSDDGRLVATGSEDKTARIWTVADGRQVTLLRGHEGGVTSVAFAPRGRLLATGGRDGTARLWDVSTGQRAALLAGHDSDVLSVAFATDGMRLATASADTTARLWSVPDGRQIAVLRGHAYRVLAVAFSPDGKLVATGSEDKTARLWSVPDGRQIAVLRGHEDGISAVAFSADGNLLVTGSDDRTARLWQVPGGRGVAVLRGHTAPVSSVAFTSDGRLLVTGSVDRTTRLWPVGQALVDLACARVRDLPLAETDRERFGVDSEWCTPEVATALRTTLGLDGLATAAPLRAAR